MFFLNFILNKAIIFPRLIFSLIFIFFLSEDKKKYILKNKKIFNIFNSHKINQEKQIVFNPVWGFNNFEYYEFLIYFLKIFEISGFKPTILSSYKSYPFFKSANYNLEKTLISYSNYKDLKNFKYYTSNLKSLRDIMNFKWNNIEVGKFALSSTFRMTRKGDLDFNNENEKKIFFKFLAKSILNASGSINFLKKNPNVETGLFIDKGYVGEGELMQCLTNSNKKIFNFMNYYKNNLIIIKKLNQATIFKHPGEIDDNIWEKIKKDKLPNEDKLISEMMEDIKKSYKENLWYPSAGTLLNKEFYNTNQIKKYLNFKNQNKKIAVVFNHIFWDASFFYGSDLFLHYQEWFIETFKIALKNSKINWVFKIHPSNKTKNLRDKVKNPISLEKKIIQKYCNTLPEHIRLLDEESPFSSYNLYNLLDFCITVRGTSGLECAMLNKPVILAGTGKYSGKGFTYEFNTKLNYLSCINNLPTLPNSKIDFYLARKYSYYALKKKPFLLKFVNAEFQKDSLAKLRTGVNINDFNDFINSSDVKKIKNWIESEQDEFLYS